ncbi:twin-arginine translocation signal domain-containing protein [Paraburkholderia sp. BR10936]|uniref:twin-arginine translocation signal domain-containing protein n=1 Tax=Paraburkholderia sp. BR10936 TaxID=3236993 RepID=UPI0034D228A3
MHMKSRRTFLHDSGAAGAGMMLAQARMVHATSVPGHFDRLVNALPTAVCL